MDQLEGTVEQIVYYNPDNGYTVCRFAAGEGKPVTIVGSFPPLSPGEVLKLKGKWEVNPKFGKQFHVESFALALPASAGGIEKFLASGLIKGIGPVLAKRILMKFGTETIDILTLKPEKLKKVEGIGPVKFREIRKSWEEHQDIRDLIIFLQEHQVSTNLATRIYRQYGERSFHVLKSNPYQLSLDIWGVGFKTADQLALKLGMDPGSPERVKAYVLYVLEKDNEQGHVFSLESEVRAKCLEELAADDEKVDKAIAALAGKKMLVREPIASDSALYRPSFHLAQEEVVRALHKLAAVSCGSPPFDLDSAVSEVEQKLGICFSPMQRLAIKECFQKKVLVITGGPGTGKTTIIKAVVEIFNKWGREVLLAAPTGRAAKRLTETTGREARTIHRVLEFQPKKGTFRRGEKCLLSGEELIIDEFSMVDLSLMHHLLKAVPVSMRLVFVGDKDQLPSVGPGTLLRDIIESGIVTVVRLDEIFRQEKESYIVLNAHRINRGEGLVFPPKGEQGSDFYFIHEEDDRKAFEIILGLCQTRIPRWLRIPALSPQIQVISPMYKGLVGVDNLNQELQQRLNPLQEGLNVGSREFRVRDKIMQVRNDYEKETFNGDIGTIVHLDKPRFRIIAEFEGRPVVYEKDDLNDITLAYAVSVHKAQGSEYQAVVMPLLTQHFIMLQRNLFYTALTRAKKLSVIVGSYKALHIAIKNDKPVKRNSLVKEKLMLLEIADRA
jgi:exodeoxyribonuclease V alpha subunit